jgi:tripartite ATP-independent transporter DctM subunit
MLIWIFIALLALLFLGVPVILSIGIIGLAGIMITPDLVSALFPQKLFAMLDSFSLLAMPFFILAGSLMSKGGISKHLVDFAETSVGYTRGGLAQANIVASMVFSGVSGSSTADTAAIGSILIPSMVGKGYKPGYAAAITATSSTIGPIIPPSMTMIVYGSMAGVSIGGLFLAGIIPGILIGVALMVTVYIQSFIRNPDFDALRVVTGRFNPVAIVKAAGKVWVALLAPVIILGGILSGVFTATEAGVVACFYSFIVTFFLYRSVRWRDLPEIILDAAITTTIVVGIISVAGALGWLLSYLDFNDLVLGLIQGISQNPTVVLLVLLSVMLVLTMFIESLAVLVILVPVAVYVTQSFNYNPYYLGLVLVMATQIGATTPPVAVLLFVATSIADCTYAETIKYAWPFIATLVIVLLLVVFFPPLASYIPSVFLGP